MLRSQLWRCPAHCPAHQRSVDRTDGTSVRQAVSCCCSAYLPRPARPGPAPQQCRLPCPALRCRGRSWLSAPALHSPRERGRFPAPSLKHRSLTQICCSDLYCNYPGMPPMPNGTGSRYEAGTSGLASQLGGLSVTQTGFSKMWGGETLDLLQNRHILPPGTDCGCYKARISCLEYQRT